MDVKVNGEWNKGESTFVKVNGEWADSKSVYVKVDGEWKKTSSEQPGNYGRVIYKATPESTEKLYVDIKTLNEFNSLVDPDVALGIIVGPFMNNWSVSVNGVVLHSAGDENVIIGIEIGEGVTEIPSGFMTSCKYFNEPITFPDNVTRIGSAVLCGFFGESAYNAPVTFSKNLVSIGETFMYAQSLFDQPLTIPKSVESIGEPTGADSVGAFLGLCSSFNSNITIEGENTRIGQNFLVGCRSFNKSITIPTVSEIPEGFLMACESFNMPIVIPNSVEVIGDDFLYDCLSFNQKLVIPDSVKSIGTEFMAYIDSLYGRDNYIDFGSLSADVIASHDRTFAVNYGSDAYTNGIYIKGEHADEIMAKFPNSDTSPYRKLVKYEEADWGYITYWDGNSTTEYKTIQMTSQADWDLLGQNSTSATSTMIIQGVTITKGGSNAIRSVKIGESVTYIPDYFLYSCTKLAEHDIVGNNVVTVGKNFLARTNTVDANSRVDVILPKVETIGTYFWYRSYISGGQIIISEFSIKSIGNNFMYDIYNYTGEFWASKKLADVLAVSNTDYAFYAYLSSYPPKKQGVKIIGSDVDYFISKFPDSTYRHLVKG